MADCAQNLDRAAAQGFCRSETLGVFEAAPPSKDFGKPEKSRF